MDKAFIEAKLNEIIEELASVEHERWSHWQQYMHGKGQKQQDGSLLIPADLVQRWERQMTMPYAALAETEKESDREQVRLYIPLVAAGLARQ